MAFPDHADNAHMTCTRCGSDAVVKRGEGFYCGKCAITRDWQEVIALVQDARVDTPIAGQAERRLAAG